jgi:hypothetical protein
MFEIKIDTEAVEQRLAEMAEGIEHLKRVDLGQELSDWQSEDLHRNRPFTMRSRAKGRAATVIRPHSLYEIERSIAYQRRGGRSFARLVSGKAGKKTLARYLAFEPKTSMRPFLRPAMYERLVERMVEMAEEKLKW